MKALIQRYSKKKYSLSYSLSVQFRRGKHFASGTFTRPLESSFHTRHYQAVFNIILGTGNKIISSSSLVVHSFTFMVFSFLILSYPIPYFTKITVASPMVAYIIKIENLPTFSDTKTDKLIGFCVVDLLINYLQMLNLSHF